MPASELYIFQPGRSKRKAVKRHAEQLLKVKNSERVKGTKLKLATM